MGGGCRKSTPSLHRAGLQKFSGGIFQKSNLNLPLGLGGILIKTLKFNIVGQSITLDPECNAEKLVPGSEGYVLAEFTFSEEWDKCDKVAAFYSNLGREFEPQVLKSGNLCIIPLEALRMSVFKVKVFGKKDDYTICTNKVIVHQKGGKS